jgi:hypothetical protein
LTTSTSTPINIGNMYIADNAALRLTAPTANIGSYQVQGIAIWQDPRAPNPSDTDANHYTPVVYANGALTGSDGVNAVSAGGSTDITGVVYFPSQGLFYQGGSGGSSCTQIVAFSIDFKASAQFNYPANCSTTAGVSQIGSLVPTLAE